MLPLWYLLVPYAIFLAFATLFVFFNLYHIASFGLQSIKTTLVFLAYLFSYVAVVWISLSLLANIPWKESVDLHTIIQMPSFTRASSSQNDL